MDDTLSSDSVFDDGVDDDDLFDSVAYHDNAAGDDYDNDSVYDDRSVVSSDDIFDDVGSFEGDEDIEEQREQESVLPSSDAQRQRIEYEARRSKSSEFMNERLMIHADEYYKSKSRRRRRSKVLLCVSLVFGVLAIIMTTIWVVTPIIQHVEQQQQQQQQQETELETNALVETTRAPEFSGDDTDLLSQATNLDIANQNNEENPINVPFGNRHNLNFDGLLFVKTSCRGIHHGSNTLPVFDSYAKTLDPITELHFEPGESNTSKQIVLTTTQPELMVQNLGDTLENDPGLVLSIGLESNGELWLPQNTGQRISNLDADSLRSTRHHSHETIKKNFYGPGDRFVLTISEDAISLFRNDHHELVGMWTNPSTKTITKNMLSLHSTSSESPPQPLYAQIWFKEAESSMLATAWKDQQLVQTRDGIH